MSEKIKNIQLVDELTSTTKIPVGNTGEDEALTTNMQQITDYVSENASIDYSQITDAPEINDATITIKQGGTTKGTFTLNQASDGIIELDTGGGGGGGDTVYWDDIQDKPNFATVATSGSYDDLTDTPTIGNGTLTITQGGVTKGTFTANATTNTTIELDAGGGGGGSAAWGSITGTLSDQTDLQSALDAKTPIQTTTTGSTSTVTVAVQGGKIYSYSTPLTSLTLSSVENSQYETDIYFTTDTTCTLSIPNTVRSIIGSTTLIGNTDYTIVIKDNNVIIGYEGYTSGSVAWNDVTGKPTFATVATSGSYNDLSNTPTIPSAPVQSDWNESDTSSLAYIANKPTIPAAQVNSDWNSSSGVSQILNKPSMTTETWTFTLSDNSTITRTVYLQPSV